MGSKSRVNASENPPPTSRQLAGSLIIVALSGLVVLAGTARRWVLGPATATASPSTAGPATAPAPVGGGPPAAPTVTASWPEAEGPEQRASCAIEDPGPGPYQPDWKKLPIGRMVVPDPPPTKTYDLVLHLHGGEGARRVIARAGLGVVLVAVDAGVGSRAYAETFYGPEPLEEILASVDEMLAPAQLGHLILSSWSAGYGGVREILKQHPTTPSAVVLLDSVHDSFEPDGETLVDEGLVPFVLLADRAKHEGAIVVLTHSAIEPPGYASTTEVADYLLETIDGRRRYGGLVPRHGVELKTRYDEGGFHLRGYTGTGKGAHCAHLEMLGEILKDEVLPALPSLD
jgi:hypothetical protein